MKQEAKHRKLTKAHINNIKISDMNLKDKSILKIRYQLEKDDMKPLEIYEFICKKRGYITRGTEIDYERGAIAILDDFRKGKLGRITLDERQWKENWKNKKTCWIW